MSRQPPRDDRPVGTGGRGRHARGPRFSWRMLLHPLRSQEEGTAPAGIVLVVVLVALLVAAVLNADATLRKSNAAGEGWRNEVAQVVADVSGTLRLTSLRNRADEALGKNTTTDIDVADLLAEQQAEQAADPEAADPEAEAAAEAAEAEAAAAQAEADRLAALEPDLPAATPAAPLSMYIGGDSIARDFGQAMQRVATATGVIAPTLDYRAATGLSRPDFFNWPEHLVRDVVPTNPQLVVLQFGANDSQNFTIDGRPVERLSEEWLTEYRRRVAATMDLLQSPDNQRLVVWVGAPIMGPGSGVKGMDLLNQIYWEESQSRPWVSYFDTYPFLADANMAYVDTAIYADGQSRELRQSDKVHLSAAGGSRLAWGVIDLITETVDLSAGNVEPPPSEAAPPEVSPRDELPPPAPA
ncbi:SGNH/GDSL hydrolase family protein [Rhabdothermincola salaria]|uniref:DUF459 domain-containing protein n=1 Tax=Rhabdothermincola salaria TaxID=2903142 RepID=UPI001E3DA5FA|nr:SGNH/GDSL hydrolase family protein [Rhabdothermincola salaria]MCD9623507.1 hypothetical protein [Rhabdothermincola salaria]